MKLFLVALVWTVWAVFHSALLGVSWEGRLRRLSWIDCHWRLFYALFAGITLIAPISFTLYAKGPLVLVWPCIWLPLLLNAGALTVGWLGVRAFGGAGPFLGIGALAQKECEPPRPAKPVRGGILGWVRHPLYASALVLLWAHDMNASQLTASVVLTVYVLVGTWLEEKRLLAQWGPTWSEYKKDVSAYFPLKKIGCLFARGNGRKR